jgi:hypothetical protein
MGAAPQAIRLIESFLGWLGVDAARLVVIPTVVAHQKSIVRSFGFKGRCGLLQYAARKIVVAEVIVIPPGIISQPFPSHFELKQEFLKWQRPGSEWFMKYLIENLVPNPRGNTELFEWLIDVLISLDSSPFGVVHFCALDPIPAGKPDLPTASKRSLTPHQNVDQAEGYAARFTRCVLRTFVS